MCGISGIFSEHIQPNQEKLLEDIVKSQFSRGPDHQAITKITAKNCELLLGHNRLSIIDLSASAHQPMWDDTRRFCIVYNGEIYNYLELRDELRHLGLTFNTHSDTEVILKAFTYWGIDALSKFDGPFAFALWDNLHHKLWLCRDRFGVRPLYYTQINNVLYFASTSNTLAKSLNLAPNFDYLARGIHFLVYENGSAHCAYNNLHALQSGHYLSANFNETGRLQTSVSSYYNLKANVIALMDSYQGVSTNRLLELTQQKLERAVRIRLRSDVPLAISLSGGLDSTTVAALTAEKHEDTIGFSVGDPKNAKTEGPVIANSARFLDLNIHYVWPKPQEMADALVKTLKAQDAPFASPSIIAQYLLYQHVKANHIKVLLGGQGGDEAFMGYKKFLLFYLQDHLQNKNYLASAKYLFTMIPMLFAEVGGGLAAYWRHRHRYLHAKKTAHSIIELPADIQMNLHKGREDLWHRQMHDITQFSLPTLLRYEDRNGMAHSVESRLPFLDHHLVELGLALPAQLKVRSGYGKWPIRAVMKSKIPESVRMARYKRGFDLPLKALLNAGFGNMLRMLLHDQHVKPFLTQSHSIQQLFSDQALLEHQSRITEAFTLLWLTKVHV